MSTSLEDIRANLAARLAALSPGPLLIHSDVMGALGLIKTRANAQEILTGHLHCLEQLIGERTAYFPTFNYDYPARRLYDVANDPGQVGRLSEHIRLTQGMWRSAVPIFNVCGKTPAPIAEAHPDGSTRIDPFGTCSIFDHLYEAGGTVLFYGARFHAFTGIHYMERRSGDPLYRYDKYFPGSVRLADGQMAETEIKSHVRPMGRVIDYDFDGLWNRLSAEGLGWEHRMPGAVLLALDFRATVDFYCAVLAQDPFALLTKDNRTEWARTIERLGRRVELSDFEMETL